MLPNVMKDVGDPDKAILPPLNESPAKVDGKTDENMFEREGTDSKKLAALKNNALNQSTIHNMVDTVQMVKEAKAFKIKNEKEAHGYQFIPKTLVLRAIDKRNANLDLLTSFLDEREFAKILVAQLVVNLYCIYANLNPWNTKFEVEYLKAYAKEKLDYEILKDYNVCQGDDQLGIMNSMFIVSAVVLLIQILTSVMFIGNRVQKFSHEQDRFMKAFYQLATLHFILMAGKLTYIIWMHS